MLGVKPQFLNSRAFILEDKVKLGARVTSGSARGVLVGLCLLVAEPREQQ